MRLKLLQCFGRVIDQGEAGRLSTSELGLETENVDLVLVGLVKFGKLGSEVVLGDVGTVGVEDITVRSSDSAPQSNALFSPGEGIHGFTGPTYTTICLRPRRGLRMNLRVRSVTGCSRSAILMGVKRRSNRKSAYDV